jgi:hypothetical protein
LVCAARTPTAIVRLERISTQVLMPPRMVSRNWLAYEKTCGSLKRMIAYITNSAPKNSTSVARNTHMPSLPDSNCWFGVSKWCARNGYLA